MIGQVGQSLVLPVVGEFGVFGIPAVVLNGGPGGNPSEQAMPRSLWNRGNGLKDGFEYFVLSFKGGKVTL